MKKYILILAVLASATQLKAQQDPAFSHYMFNQLVLNPAYAGTHDYWQANILLRKQWVNLEGAPHSEFFTVDGPIKSKNMGLAFTLSNDEIGITSKTRIGADYSYQVPLGKGKLSFGLRGHVSFERADFGKLETTDQGDQIYSNRSDNSRIPNFGSGVYYYTGKSYLGLSVPHIINYENETRLNSNLDNNEPNQERHYFFTAGHTFELNNWLALQPSTMMRYANNAPLQFDVNLNALLKQTFWLGVSYRLDESVTALAQYQVTNKWRVGYAYDYNISQLADYNNGSHEIMLAFDFLKPDIAIKTPRYF